MTRKKVKHINFRIRPSEPEVIHISIPYAMSYDAALKMLEQPRILRWLENCQKKRTERPRPQMQYEDRKKQIPLYQKRLEALLPGMFQKWERILGVKCGRITVRDTRSQWGSCSIRTGNISISVWLGAYPEECIEYVVGHELVHLLEAGHNERFYGFLDKYYPNWKKCRERLREEP